MENKVIEDGPVTVQIQLFRSFYKMIGLLVWHGGMNLLGKEDAWDNLIRVKDSKAASELLIMAHEITRDV